MRTLNSILVVLDPQQEEQPALERAAYLASRYGVPDDRIHALEGPVGWVVPEVSRELIAEFVVLGNVSREGKAGVSIGSTAESTLDALNTNVLIVKT